MFSEPTVILQILCSVLTDALLIAFVWQQRASGKLSVRTFRFVIGSLLMTLPVAILADCRLGKLMPGAWFEGALFVFWSWVFCWLPGGILGALIGGALDRKVKVLGCHLHSTSMESDILQSERAEKLSEEATVQSDKAVNGMVFFGILLWVLIAGLWGGNILSSLL